MYDNGLNNTIKRKMQRFTPYTQPGFRPSRNAKKTGASLISQLLVGRFLGSPQISFPNENGKLRENLFILFSEDTHETPLHMCVQRHDSKFTKLLVKANADLYIRDNSGDRPIDIKQENEDVTNTLKAAMFEKDRVEKAKTSSS